MTSTTAPPIKIVIPVHEEEGWTARSPEGAASVKSRLEERKQQTPKSPATLQRHAERAAQLHQLHIEATQQRAALQNQRAKEVAAARLRMAATARQNLLTKFEAQAAHREEKKRAAAQVVAERLERRKSGFDAVHAARAAAKAEREHRAAVIRNREEEAARQAEKMMQQRVQRVAFHGKQALAKATAVKEREQEALADKHERW